MGLFKLFSSTMADTNGVPANTLPQPSQDVLAHFFLSETWTLHLNTGIFELGPCARARPSIRETERCGLLTLLRCYPAADRPKVMQLFEAASSEPAAFCFATVSLHPDQGEQPFTCVGETASFGADGQGLISGIFMFPRASAGNCATPH